MIIEITKTITGRFDMFENGRLIGSSFPKSHVEGFLIAGYNLRNGNDTLEEKKEGMDGIYNACEKLSSMKKGNASSIFVRI